MSSRLFRTSLPIVCLLVSCLGTGSVIADWTGKAPGSYYNHGYGDFPPLDIDRRISSDLNNDATEKNKLPDVKNTTAVVNNQAGANPSRTRPAQNFPNQGSPNQNVPGQVYQGQAYQNQRYSGQNRQSNRQPVYGGSQQYRNYSQPYARSYNRNSGFNGPWDNRGSNFGGPWNNSGSGFSGPWDSNGSGFNMPWGNNSGNNNGSGFNPMGNGGSWGW